MYIYWALLYGLCADGVPLFHFIEMFTCEMPGLTDSQKRPCALCLTSPCTLWLGTSVWDYCVIRNELGRFTKALLEVHAENARQSQRGPEPVVESGWSHAVPNLQKRFRLAAVEWTGSHLEKSMGEHRKTELLDELRRRLEEAASDVVERDLGE